MDKQGNSKLVGDQAQKISDEATVCALLQAIAKDQSHIILQFGHLSQLFSCRAISLRSGQIHYKDLLPKNAHTHFSQGLSISVETFLNGDRISWTHPASSSSDISKKSRSIPASLFFNQKRNSPRITVIYPLIKAAISSIEQSSTIIDFSRDGCKTSCDGNINKSVITETTTIKFVLENKELYMQAKVRHTSSIFMSPDTKEPTFFI